MERGLNVVVAIDRNRLIGDSEKLPWYLPADLKHFRELTTGNVVIMGRKTYDSIPERFRPLPDRQNVVLSNQQGLQLEGVDVVNSLDEAIDAARDGEIFIIGGAKIYHLALPYTNRMFVTEIDAEFEGDVYFPDPNWSNWREINRETHDADEANPYNYAFVEYERIR